jgi:hypothetical protein
LSFTLVVDNDTALFSVVVVVMVVNQLGTLVSSLVTSPTVVTNAF